MGPVDNPHEPPCKRCLREGKECFFAATRKNLKRKSVEGVIELDSDEEYAKKNQRKRVKLSPRSRLSPSRVTSTPTTSNLLPSANASFSKASSAPITPEGNVGNLRPLRRPFSKPLPDDEDESERVSNETAAQLQRGEIFGGHDALNLLATASAGLQHRTSSMNSTRPSINNTLNTPGSYSSLAMSPPAPSLTASQSYAVPPTTSHQSPPANYPPGYAPGSGPYEAARQAWSRMVYVRKGWFTAEESMQYIEYYYEHLAPLTPVQPPSFRHPSKHEDLLLTSPTLAITMITIASRYMKLSGPGAQSRSYAIHSDLWKDLQQKLNHVAWGQDKFPGSFDRTNTLSASNVNPLHRNGFRSIGTVESLILLTEWLPRALHFPPSFDDDFMTSTKPRSTSPPGYGGQRMNSWLEPCWRSDHMCWSLLGTALTIAIEIGIFDNTSEKAFRNDTPPIFKGKVAPYFARKEHVRDLLEVYISLTSGRLGLTSILPERYMSDVFATLPMGRFRFTSRGGPQQDPANDKLADAMRGTLQQKTVYFWIHLAHIMHLGNQYMYPNRNVTRELIRGGKYAKLIKRFEPLLEEWMSHFTEMPNMYPDQASKEFF